MANQQDRPPAASSGESWLADTVKAMRPMVPARDFETSRRFYEELGFRPQVLAEGLVEMHLGAWSFILQDYYVKQWANNFVFRVRVSDVNLWWDIAPATIPQLSARGALDLIPYRSARFRATMRCHSEFETEGPAILQSTPDGSVTSSSICESSFASADSPDTMESNRFHLKLRA